MGLIENRFDIRSFFVAIQFQVSYASAAQTALQQTPEVRQPVSQHIIAEKDYERRRNLPPKMLPAKAHSPWPAADVMEKR